MQFSIFLLTGIFRYSYDHNAFKRMPWNIIEYKSILVQVMACCRQATSHHEGQYWPRYMAPYSVTRQQRFEYEKTISYWSLTHWVLVWAPPVRLKMCAKWSEQCTRIHPWWRHQMETFPALLAHRVGNPPVTVDSPYKWPVTRNFDVSLICAWTNG